MDAFACIECTCGAKLNARGYWRDISEQASRFSREHSGPGHQHFQAAQSPEDWIAQYGDDAYWAAVAVTVAAAQSGDDFMARSFGALAVEMTRRGYHKRKALHPLIAGGPQ